jgi:hypothetical protein
VRLIFRTVYKTKIVANLDESMHCSDVFNVIKMNEMVHLFNTIYLFLVKINYQNSRNLSAHQLQKRAPNVFVPKIVNIVHID